MPMLDRTAILTKSLPLFLLVFLVVGVSHVSAQSAERPGGAFYGRFGAGFSDYTGDFPAQNASHPFDLQELTRGSGFPFTATGEVGYKVSSSLSFGLGIQAGNYPIVGHGGGPSGISDSYRYTSQLLARYTFGSASQSVAPYVDGGVNATFGGDSPPTSTGFGPSLGVGVDILLSRSLSFYVESRFNFTLPDDAIDGAENSTNDAITGPLDSANQLLGFGLSYTLSSPTAPKVIALDGPTEVQTGTSVTYTATINEEAAARPLSYEWTFGDGTTSEGQTVSHTYEQPGTYTVTFTVRNEAGSARRTLTVKASQPEVPPKVVSLDAPSEVQVGESASFAATINETATRPLSYQWQFGDGTASEGRTASHTYEQPGTYTAVFTVRNDAGEASTSVTVAVTPSGTTAPAKITSIGATPNPARVGDSIRFSSSVEGATPIMREWHFGDGATATSASPLHTYDEPGQYTVRLKASNGDGTDTRTLTVRVGQPLANQWAIVVASMSRSEGAEEIARKYRDRFQSLPVTVVKAETSEGIRHRVAVGRFESQSDAQQALKRYSAQLPSGAWLLPPQ